MHEALAGLQRPLQLDVPTATLKRPFRLLEHKSRMAGLLWTLGIIAFLAAVVSFGAKPEVETNPYQLGIKWLARRFPGGPPPWAPISISTLALVAGTTSAIFAGLNYFKTPKARASLVIDRVEDFHGKMTFGGVERIYHSPRIWLSNTGQSVAVLRQAILNPQLTTDVSPEGEDGRMARTLQMHGVASNIEIAPGTKAFLSTPAGFSDDGWSELLIEKAAFYVFGEIRYNDELSDKKDIIMDICVRVDRSLNFWANCAHGHNKTVRP
jgi:hypothetical protein